MNRYIKYNVLILLLFAFHFSTGQAIEVDTMKYNPQQLVREVFIKGSVEILNVNAKGVQSAMGYFSNGKNCLGFDEGIILSTGKATDAAGPNNQIGCFTDMLVSGDDDLNDVLDGMTTYDAAALYFDFIPNSDTITFEYVFGSEEYPEYVGKGYNDVFAFLLTGPKPGGGSYENENIALIPGTDIPVSIANVNHKTNFRYYRFDTDNIALQYDGITQTLKATATVIHGERYKIKLAIADVGDPSHDSGVFLKATSFHSINAILSENFCYGDTATFSIAEIYNVENVHWKINQQNISPDSLKKDFSFHRIFEKPGDYQITAYISYNDGSNSSVLEQEITIYERPEIDLGEDIHKSLRDSIVLELPDQYAQYRWSHTEKDTAKVIIKESGEYSVEVTNIYGCSATDRIAIDFVPKIEIAIPNSFTPNHDGINDRWEIGRMENYPNAAIKIFTRTGKLIRQYKGADRAWDGTYNGRPLSSGTYWFVIELFNGTEPYKGFVTIVR